MFKLVLNLMPKLKLKRHLLLILFPLMLITSCGKGQSLIGNKAPDFTLNMIDGGQIGLTELSGKPLILYFFASW